MKLLVGQSVNVSSALGVVSRIVVEDYGEIVTVCLKEEYEAAKNEGRIPVSVGCRLSDIVENK